ncbi:AMP-binding protein [Falsigemmobacter faecalis]|uniref:Acyl-CoA synthetase n=1 Tax=Falsigemmobacter faecalis TaxID=2488730 RepID=A0A3P3D8L3_9RHOB|nr:AMP-binding protein [Falsigemmobacter faecalis]RRH69772.1 acyl-CoA synthetase [Falsigemmobacter faecalis]
MTTIQTPRLTARALRRITCEADLFALEDRGLDSLLTATSLYDMFRTNALLHGARPGLTVLASADPGADCVTLSHADLFAQITRAANLFGAKGLRRAEVVTLLSRSHPQLPVALWGAQVAGVASCLNHLLSTDMILALMQAEAAEMLVCPGPALDPDLWTRACEVAARLPHLKAVFVFGGLPAGMEARFCDFDAEMAAQRGDALVHCREPELSDRAALFHTGGTTGLPKLVPQTHLNQLHAAWSLAQMFDLSQDDTGLNGFPLYHVGGTTTMGLSVLSAAGHMVLLSPDGFRNRGIVAAIWRLTERFRATVLGAVPTVIGSFSEVPKGGADLSSLRFAMTGGSPLPAAVAERFTRATGLTLIEQYGMTETVAALATTPLHGPLIRGSVGLRCPFSQIAVMRQDADGLWQDCARGESGIVTVSGPQVCAGYLDPRHNRGAFTPSGAFVTGDLGYLDAAGYLHLTGREKDLIIRGGHNIDPLAIEEVANAHPDVALSAAVGMPDAYAGEIPVVFVTPRPGAGIDLAALAEFLRQGISEPPARPRHIFVLPDLPVTGVGKIFKPELRRQALRHKLVMLLRDLAPEACAGDLSPGECEEAGGYVLQITLPSRQAAAPLQKALSAAALDLNLRLRLNIRTAAL